MVSRILTLSIAWLLAGSEALAQSGEWRPTSATIRTGGSGSLVDVTGDGRADLIRQRRDKQEIAILPGDGAGGFSDPAYTLSVGYDLATVTVGDANNDGRADLCLGSYDEKNEYIQILLGDGEGRFAAASPRWAVMPTIEFYKGIHVFGDFNEDGRADLLVGNGRRDDLHILYGDGTGGFIEASVVMLGHEPGRFFLEVADLDADGHLDILAPGTPRSGANPRLIVRYGDGNGGFDRKWELPLPLGASRIALGDLSGDGRPDLVLTRDRSVEIYDNDGQGRFRLSAPSPDAADGELFGSQLTDVDGDQKLDLVIAAVDRVIVLNGTTTGFAPAPGSPFPVEPGAYSVQVHDLNSDGRPDIVTGTGVDAESIHVLFGG